MVGIGNFFPLDKRSANILSKPLPAFSAYLIERKTSMILGFLSTSWQICQGFCCHTSPNERLLQLIAMESMRPKTSCCHTSPNERLLQRLLAVRKKRINLSCHTSPNERLLQLNKFLIRELIPLMLSYLSK